ncbi:AhpC/TSA antioxidant enzyme-domain-containing protein [Coniochaeta sp. 2T2.1]|nr:AhpC/TSA antioxidant enzyme-domain-containing protein [Coniochaeta sp. 2T2.1]
MAVSSDPPAVGEPEHTSAAAAQNGSSSTAADQQQQQQTANAVAPLAGGPQPPSQTSEQQAQKTEEVSSSIPIPAHDDSNGVNPLDFEGAVTSNNELPSPATLRKIEDYVVLDRDGKSHPFKSLYTGKHVARRVLVIFVRHFFCGNCQEYLRTLSSAITPDSLLRLPISTFIAVVGCGDPGLIDMYAEATGCPFPVYADPTRKLYAELGMVKTLALGERPAYMKKGMLRSSIDSILQGLKQIPKGLAMKAGDQRQIGGEFLFEPVSLFTPMSSPWGGGEEKRLGNGNEGSIDGLPGSDAAGAGDAEPKRVTWCHRMKTTRDHAEIPELMEVLGLEGLDKSRPPRASEGEREGENKRWSRALETRKGTGASMAGQMSAMKAEAAVAAPAPATTGA